LVKAAEERGGQVYESVRIPKQFYIDGLPTRFSPIRVRCAPSVCSGIPFLGPTSRSGVIASSSHLLLSVCTTVCRSVLVHCPSRGHFSRESYNDERPGPVTFPHESEARSQWDTWELHYLWNQNAAVQPLQPAGCRLYVSSSQSSKPKTNR